MSFKACHTNSSTYDFRPSNDFHYSQNNGKRPHITTKINTAVDSKFSLELEQRQNNKKLKTPAATMINKKNKKDLSLEEYKNQCCFSFDFFAKNIKKDLPPNLIVEDEKIRSLYNKYLESGYNQYLTPENPYSNPGMLIDPNISE